MYWHIKLIFIISFIKCVFSREALLDPCNHRDLECMERVTDTIINKASSGRPEYGIKPIEPLKIKTMKYPDPDRGIVLQFNNIKISGLSKMNMVDFQLDTDTKLVQVVVKVKVNIKADVKINGANSAEFISGTFKAKDVSSLVTVRYLYDVKVDSDDVEHFIIGPETNTCEAVGVPEVTINLQNSDSVENDPDVVADYLNRAMEIKQEPICPMIAESFHQIVANLRSTFKIIPKTELFKDV